MKGRVEIVAYLLSCVWLFVTPWTVAHQASLSVGFPSQESWRGCPFPLQGIFPTQGWSLPLLYWQMDSLLLSHQEATAVIKRPTNNERWRGCGEKGALLRCWWECNLVQPLRTILRFLKKKTENRTTMWSSNPTPGYISEKGKNWNS